MRAKLNPRHTDDSFVLRESQSAFESKAWGVLLWVDSDKDLCSLITRMTVHQENRRVLVHSRYIGSFHATWSGLSLIKNFNSQNWKLRRLLCYRFLRVSFGSSGLGSSVDRGHCSLSQPRWMNGYHRTEFFLVTLGSNRFCIGSASIQLHWRRQENYSQNLYFHFLNKFTISLRETNHSNCVQLNKRERIPQVNLFSYKIVSPWFWELRSACWWLKKGFRLPVIQSRNSVNKLTPEPR